MQASLLAKQGKQPLDTGAGAVQVSQQQLLERAQTLTGQSPGGGPRTWVAGVAPTTKGAPTRSLMMRLPSEGRSAELSVPPARPAWYAEVKEEGHTGGAPSPREGPKRFGSAQGLGDGAKGNAAVHGDGTKSKACVIL